jgi:pentatricopeptide repeat protein
MVKVCCYRGALLRAFQVVDETMPRHGLEPDTRTYTILLEALARVGDTNTIKELYFEMSNKSLHLDQFVVRAIVDGLLNSGDIAGAITYTQDIFNQHTVLPPVSSHLKILEFALANELVYEAKRHIYFIQQLWRWKPNRYHPKHLIFHVKTTKQSPSLSKQSLHRLFEYFGETLEDADFLEEYRFR